MRKPCNLQNKVAVTAPTLDKIKTQRGTCQIPLLRWLPKGAQLFPHSAADPKPSQHLSRNSVSSAVNKLKCFKKYPKQLPRKRLEKQDSYFFLQFFFPLGSQAWTLEDSRNCQQHVASLNIPLNIRKLWKAPAHIILGGRSPGPQEMEQVPCWQGNRGASQSPPRAGRTAQALLAGHSPALWKPSRSCPMPRQQGDWQPRVPNGRLRCAATSG